MAVKEVYIDGVRYLPAKEVDSDVYDAVARETLSLFWGEASDEELERYINDEGLGVEITEAPGKYTPTIAEFTEKVVKRLQDAKAESE